MTDTEITPDEPVEPASEPEQPIEPQEGEQEQAPATKADREARLRKRAQEAEAERDDLRDLVRGLRMNDVERRLSGVLTNPADVWHAATIDDLLDDAGVIDTAKIDTVVATIRTDHPNWVKPAQLPGNQRPAGPISHIHDVQSEHGWRDAFAPKPVR